MSTAEARLEYVEKQVTTDLKFLFTQSEVEEQDQYELALAGYKTVRKFVGLAEERALVLQLSIVPGLLLFDVS